MKEKIQYIYEKLEDTLSKKIYIDRLNYSITCDNSYLENMINMAVRSQVKWNVFCESLKEKAAHSKMYIFGAGIWGNILYQETKDFVPWQAVIDSQPIGKTVGGLSVISLKNLTECDSEEIVIAISSYKNRQEMLFLLQKAGIAQDRIVDAGTVIYQLTEGAIYFDLEQLNPQAAYEAFVDAGCFDGLTTKSFFNWCKTKGYAYCFEPDSKNAVSIQSNLTDYPVRYELVEKALWSGTTELYIDERGDYASSVRESDVSHESQMVVAVALDDHLCGKPVTFIKMDVEGAEAEVLKGAKNTIIDQHPRLAVSIYHKPEDIWVLPELILSYYSGYRFYLRHYSFSDYDTVLYAIP